MKECNLDCYFEHEGFCSLKEHNINPSICRAKTNNDIKAWVD